MRRRRWLVLTQDNTADPRHPDRAPFLVIYTATNEDDARAQAEGWMARASNKAARTVVAFEVSTDATRNL